MTQDPSDLSVQIEVKEGYLLVRVEGVESVANDLQVGEEASKACAEHGLDRVLFDARTYDTGLSVIENVDTSKQASANRYAFKRFAMLNDKLTSSLRFMETALLNRGLVVKVFTDPDEAESWLLGDA